MASAIPYHKESYLPRKIFDNARLALAENTGYDYKINGLELIGNIFLIPIDHLPKLRHALKNPSIITVAFTTAALAGNTILFYPEKSAFYGKKAIELLKDLPKDKIKFAAYVATMITIAGYGLRALGRFQNADITDQFWHESAPADAENERLLLNPKRWFGSASNPKSDD